MSRVLKILNRGVVVDQISNMLFLDGGNTLIPVTRNFLGVFVEDTKENARILYEKGEGYLSGFLDTSGPFPVFNRLEPVRYVQTIIECDRDLGITVPCKLDEISPLDSRIEYLAALIEKQLSFIKTKISVIPVYSVKNRIYTFEVMQYRPGFVKGMHLIHRKFGLMKIVLRSDTINYKIMLEQKYRTIESTLVEEE
jgi:hypothetical protein